MRPKIKITMAPPANTAIVKLSQLDMNRPPKAADYTVRRMAIASGKISYPM
jgi:hypothetical protein